MLHAPHTCSGITDGYRKRLAPAIKTADQSASAVDGDTITRCDTRQAQRFKIKSSSPFHHHHELIQLTCSAWRRAYCSILHNECTRPYTELGYTS